MPVRSPKEELGLDVEELTYIHSYPYEKKEMLMLGFKAKVKKADFMLSGEVDSACWFKFEDGRVLFKEYSSNTNVKLTDFIPTSMILSRKPLYLWE